jgi:hypothetical protein
MEQTLLLNASFEPLKVVHWQKAITLLCQGKVEVISVYDREVRSVSITFKLPSVIRLLRYVRIRHRFDYVPFSRANIYARDDHTCQSAASGRPKRPSIAWCRSRGATRLGEHRHMPSRAAAGRAGARRQARACTWSDAQAPESAPALRITIGLRHPRAGATTSTGTSSRGRLASAPLEATRA